MVKDKIKLFNICVWICAICYLFAFFSTYFKVNGEYARYEAIYAEMLKESSDFNNNNNYNNAGNTGITKETPKFTDATSAIDFAYNNYINSEFSEYEVIGNISAQASGITLPIYVHQIQIIYPSGTILCENRIWVEDDKYGVIDSTQRVYKEGNIYKRNVKADKMSFNKSTGEITANYGDKKYKFEIQENFATFIINKDTITRDLYFKVNYNPYNGQVESYSASASLHTKRAVDGYDNRLKREGTLSEIPSFSKLEIHCVIDRDGQLKSAVIKESYSSTRKVPVLGTVKYTSSDVFNLKIVNLGTGKPSVQEPVIN